MSTNERVIHDQVSLAAAYHFLMALTYMIGAAAILVYAVLPILSGGPTDLAQRLFLPITGVLLSVLLVGLYAFTGAGLVKMSNSARMGAVFLALFGAVGGLFGQAGAVALGVSSLAPNWTAVVGLGLGTAATYALTASVDLLILVFLLKEPVREAFYAYSASSLPEPWRGNGRERARRERRETKKAASRTTSDVPAT